MRLEPRKPDLPEWIRDSLALHLDAVADLLRVARNDSGHLTGRHLDSGTAYVNLRMFGRYTEKLWALRRPFPRARAAVGAAGKRIVSLASQWVPHSEPIPCGQDPDCRQYARPPPATRAGLTDQRQSE